MILNFFAFIAKDVEFYIVHKQTHVFLIPFSIIMTTSEYCAYSRWYTHFGKHSHYWFNSCESCFTSFVGVIAMIASQTKIVSYCDWHLENDFILLAISRYLDINTSKRTTFFINVLTWHDHLRPLEVILFQLYIHFIDEGCQWLFKQFKLSLSCIRLLWQSRRLLLDVMSFQVFHLSRCTTCSVLQVMGLGPRFCVFSS
jgi:hypothetical protein